MVGKEGDLVVGIGDLQDMYLVVDIQDNFVLFEGNLEDCLQFQEEQYAGLVVVEKEGFEDGDI